MTDEGESVELPRFSRSISLVFGPAESDRRGVVLDSVGVLPSFSGLLDVRVERGRAPMLDLSYLTLAPLLHRGLERSASRGPDQSIEDVRLDHRSAVDSDRAGQSSEGEESERRVKDVVFGEPPAETDDRDVDGSMRVLDDADGDPSRRDAGAADGRTGQPDHPGRDARSSPDRAIPDRDIGTTVRRPWTVTEPANEPTKRESSAGSPGTQQDTQSGRQSTSRYQDASGVDSAEAPGTVAEGDAVHPREPNRDQSHQTDAVTTTVVDSGDGPARSGARGGRRGGRNRAREVSRGAWSDGPTPPATAFDETGTGVARSQSSGDAVQPNTGRGRGGGPRMVVDAGGRDAGADGSEIDTTAGDTRDRPGTDTTQRSGTNAGDQPAHGQQPRDVESSPIMQATSDPDSRLIDRLYRTLKERDAIERRREGIR